MQNFKIHYSCVVDSDPKFIWQSNIFIHSLISVGVSPEHIFINIVFDDKQLESEFKSLGVNVLVLDKFGDKKYCNKLAQFDNHQLANCDYIFLCDCDIGFIKPLDALAHAHKDRLIGKPVDAANPPLDILGKIFEAYGNRLGRIVDVSGGQSSTYNVNGGFVGIPANKFLEFGARWKELAVSLLHDSNVQAMLKGYEKHVDQISFAMAASEVDYFTDIDARYNFPIHDENLILFNQEVISDIHCIHYHNQLTSLGLVELSGNRLLDKAIVKLNSTVKNNFNNRIFWNFRYKYFPELGSGQGSRGMIKARKRKLLKNFGVENYKSIVDFGCGDGETLKGLALKNYLGIDSSKEALIAHEKVRPLAEFLHVEKVDFDSLSSELVICFEVLIHQHTANDFNNIINQLAHITQKRLIISGYESGDNVDESHMCFFYKPLKQALLETGKFSSVYKVSQYDNIAVFVADVESVANLTTGNVNDIEPHTLNELTSEFDEAFKDHLFTCISTSRTHFGWYTKHLPRVFEYPWLLNLVSSNLEGKVFGEFGSGLSALPYVLSQRGAQVHTIDAGPNLTNTDLSKANEWGFFDYQSVDADIHSYNTFLEESTFAPQSFDAWYSISVIEHVPAEIRRNILSYIATSLKKNGKLYLTLDLAKGGTNLWNYSAGQQVEAFEKHGALSTIMAELEALGFMVESVETQVTPDTERVDLAYLEAVKYQKNDAAIHDVSDTSQGNALIITGFHRSATSATALQLQAAGLDIGGRLMLGNISNPLGHGEDLSVVAVHDKILSDNQTNWQFHDEVSLSTIEESLFQQYIDSRDEALKKGVNELEEINSSSWGVKDPRACLFFDTWNSILGDRGHYLIILRHWSASIESLLHRSSRELSHHLNNTAIDDPHIKFWKEPELAANMWLAYCKRALSFAKAHPQKVLLVTQRALFEGAPLVNEVNNRFGFKLDENRDSIFNAELLRDEASEVLISQISTSLRAQLDDVWQQLLEIATYQSQDETPVFYEPPKISGQFREDYKQAISECAKELIMDQPAASTNEVERFSDWVNKVQAEKSSEPSIIRLLQQSGPAFSSELFEQLKGISVELTQRFPISGEFTMHLARWIQKNGLFELAIELYQKSLGLGYVFPHVYMTLGQCYQSINKNELAMHSYDQAILKNPNNPHFYVAKAGLCSVQGDFDSAIYSLRHAHELADGDAAILLAYSELLIQRGEIELSKSLIENYLSCHEEETVYTKALKGFLTGMSLEKNLLEGKESYQQMIKQKFVKEDKFTWLAKVCLWVSNSAAERDLITRVENHWDDIS